MKVAIISDSHDNIWNFRKVIDSVNNKVDAVIHCGDFCAPFMIKELEKFNVPVHCVFGNTDDRFTSSKLANASKLVELHGDVADVELDGKKIGIVHFPNLAKGLAFTKKYDVVFYGHNHTKSEEKIGETLLVNPGEVMGLKFTPSYAIYDTTSNTVEFFDIQ